MKQVLSITALVLVSAIVLLTTGAALSPFSAQTILFANRKAASDTNVVMFLSFDTYQTNTLASRPWFILAENGGTNVFVLSSEGHIAIGRTNIFPAKDIDITRVHDRGETARAWINMAKVDSWPSFTKGVEWWANCSTDDGVMQHTWLNNMSQSFDHQWVVNEQMALCRYSMKTNNVEVMRMQPAISGTNSPYYFATAGDVSGPVARIVHNTTNAFVVSGTGAVTTGDPGGGAGAWKLGVETVPGGTTNLTVMVGTQKYQIIATPIP